MVHSTNHPPVPSRDWSAGRRRGGTTLPDIPDVDVGDPVALAAAVDAATRALVITLGRAEEEVLPRVSVSQLRALLIISRRAPTNLNQLAEELGAIPSSASRLCDRLVAAGLVTRRTGSVDRREVELRVSAEGRRLVDGLRETRVSQLATVLATMPPEGRRALLLGLREFERAAERLDGAADETAGSPGRADGGRLSTGTDVRPSPGAEARPSPGAETRLSTGTDVRLSPGAEVRPSAGAEARLSTGADVRPSPGAEVRPSTGAEARPSAGRAAGHDVA